MSSRGDHDRRPRPPYKDRRGGKDDDEHRARNRERRSAAVGMNQFSSKRGHDRALREFKKRKEEKFLGNAELLRGYKRAMKKEGFESGKGASRRREEKDEEEGGAEIDSGDGVGRKRGNEERGANAKSYDDEAYVSNDQRPRKRRKADPLAKARQEAEQRKQDREVTASAKQQKEQDERKKQNNRKKRAKTLMQRTKRGQPLMKNVIGDLLGKIKNDVEGE